MSDKKPIVVSVIGNDSIAKETIQLLRASKLNCEVIVVPVTEEEAKKHKKFNMELDPFSDLNLFNLQNKIIPESKIELEEFPKQKRNKKSKNKLNNRQKSFINRRNR